MKESLSIRKRAIITIASICTMSVVIISVLAYQNQMHQLREGVKELAANEHRLFQSIVNADAEGLARAHTGLDRLDQLLAPFAAGKKEELLAAASPIFKEIKAQNNITHMYFIQPDGKVLLRVHKPEQAGDLLTRATFKKALATGQTASGLEMGKNYFSLRSVKPVSFQGRRIGFMEVAEEIDHVFTQMKSITGNDEGLFLTEDFLAGQSTDLKSEKVGRFRILYSTRKEVSLQLAERLLPEMAEALKGPQVHIVSIPAGRFAVGMAPAHDAAGRLVGVLFTQKEVSPLFASLWKGVAVNVLILCVIFACGPWLFYLSVRKSIKLFGALRQHIVTVTTTWDLSRRLPVESRDEIGLLAEDFNTMSERLGELVSQVSRSSRELGRVSTDILKASSTVMHAAEQQSVSVNETSSAMSQINASIKGVAQGVEGLSHSAQESSSSILEMAGSVEEVALNAGELARSVEEVSSAIEEMAASIKQVGANAGSLMEAAHVNAASILEMESSIKEVQQNALETAAISEAVRKDAELGRQAVGATIVGMSRIREASRVTSESVQTLSQRAGDIGVILSVIDDVAEQTNLLALNAAIIAAQAGEAGKGFGVVADEIKQLAERTSSSTREIAEVIRGVQDETQRAVGAIEEAERSVVEGETLSRQSGEALEKIVAGVGQATLQVGRIVNATSEQAKGGRMISQAMVQISDMVNQIGRATSEQGGGSVLIMAAAERMKALTEQVKNSTREQSDMGRAIARSTEDITGMISQIKRACDEQSRGSDQIVPAVESIMQATDSNLGAVRVLNDSMAALKTQVDVLHQEIAKLNVSA